MVVLVWMSGLTFPGTSPYVRIVKKNSSSLLKLAVYFFVFHLTFIKLEHKIHFIQVSE